MYKISLLQAQDLACAYQLEKICHQVPWSEKIFYSNQGNAYINLKIEVNNKIVGSAICHVVVDEATLFNIVIHPDYRHQGLAKKLLAELIDILLQKKIHMIWLEVRESNLSAINLYRQLGFNDITIRKNYYPTTNNQYEDAIIMAYTLCL